MNRGAGLFFVFLMVWGMAQAQYFPNLLFQQFYGKQGNDVPRRILRTASGDLIIGGNTEVFNAMGERQTNVWIIKVDSTGQELWEREVYMEGSQELRDMTATYEGGVIFSGVTDQSIGHESGAGGAYKGDFFVGQVDPYGQLEWVKNYGGTNMDQAFAVARGQYREYLIAGGSHSREGDVNGNYGQSDLWMLKIDTRGNKRLSKVMGSKGSEWATSVATCKNGDYLLAGFTNSPGYGSQSASPFGNGLLVRLDPSGETRWTKAFPCPGGGFFTHVLEDAQGRIVLTGGRQSANLGNQFWLLVLTPDGKKLVERIIGDGSDDYLTTAAACEDGGLLLGGYSTRHLQGDYAKGGDDFWLIRTDSLGQVIWRNTFGGPDNERCTDVLMYRPGVFYAIGEKNNDFNQEKGSRGKDYWLLRIDEKPCDSLATEMFARVKDNTTQRDVMIRFRARHKYGERFFWDFGDGSTSEEEQPLKKYSLPGMYQVILTVFANEGCRQKVVRDELLEVH